MTLSDVAGEFRPWCPICRAISIPPRVYSPGVQPDLTHLKGSKCGTKHVLYELKVVNPCSSDDAGTGALGGSVAFGNTADGLLNDILGTPATATSAAVPGAYDAAQRRGHTVIPVSDSASDLSSGA